MAEEEIITKDCEECEKISSSTLSEECINCIGCKKFKILRLKNDLFTKEYDKQRRLLAVLPFFMDVRFDHKPKDLKPRQTYFLSTGAKVDICESSSDVGYTYFMKIPEINVTFQELMDIKKEFERFKESNVTDNEYIKKWFLGYGILEHLLRDPKVLEININPPANKTPMRIVHADYDECVTNIYPSEDFLNYLATRLKINTGRPLNKAQPQLDGEILVGKGTKARVAAIADPFSVFGIGYSIRKHRERPWTLPLFMNNKMANSWFAGLLSLCIAHGRTFLSAGPRGSGKTSLLGSLLLEILPKYRIITIEDTQELPINAYKKLGYDLLPLKVRSALLKEGMELPFDTGLRTSLRLGDSCLIIGEIRSKEAKVLYEAMRVGAMSNVVAGTVHSDSPYGVYDRVVNDLDVPKGSFKVTDLIIIVNQIKSTTGLSRKRRVIQVTEVLKDWQDEPKFQDLMVYNPKKDELVPTKELLGGKSILLKQILERTRGYKGYKDIIRDIQLRGWAKELHIKLAHDTEQLEAQYISRANILFAKLFEVVKPLESKKKEKEFMLKFQKHLKAMFDADSQARKLKKKAEEQLKKQKEKEEAKMEKRISQKPLSDYTGGTGRKDGRLPDSTGILAQISALQTSSSLSDRLMDRLEYLTDYFKGVWNKFRSKNE
ncbi:Flp pilus assembly complex ATPase component TadA [Candidatus Woesearchaeota archaeon]|nr:Flp pilus assembly complex ATPase component TadA [Candidatus Woesearchaeota archaeon]